MRQWQYKTLTITANEQDEGIDVQLNELGNDGWDLVETYRLDACIVYTFKREKPGSF